MARGQQQRSSEEVILEKRNQDVVTLRATGLSLYEIAHKFGLSKSQVHRIIVRELERWRQENQKKIEDFITKDLVMLEKMQVKASAILFKEEPVSSIRTDKIRVALDKNRMLAMRNILMAMDRRAKLLGLDKMASKNEQDNTLVIKGGLPDDDSEDAEFTEESTESNLPTVIDPAAD